MYYAEVERVKDSHLYNKFENEEIKVSKLTFNQIKKINSSEQIQNVLTKVSIYEYLNKIKSEIIFNEEYEKILNVFKGLFFELLKQ